MLGVADIRLFCIGNYPEIMVYDPKTLDVLFTLSARIQPDWISAVYILRPPKRNGQGLLAYFFVYHQPPQTRLHKSFMNKQDNYLYKI